MYNADIRENRLLVPPTTVANYKIFASNPRGVGRTQYSLKLILEVFKKACKLSKMTRGLHR